MNEELTPKDEPMEDGGDQAHCVCMQKNADGTYDVYAKPMQRVTEAEYPDGLFGLPSLEDALKGVISLDRQGPDYASAEDEGMMQGYGAGKSDDEEMGE